MHQSILPDLAVAAAAAAAAARHEFNTSTASSSVMNHGSSQSENSLLRGLDSSLGVGSTGLGMRPSIVPPHLPPPHLSSLLHTNSQTHRELIQHQLQLHHQHQQLQGKNFLCYFIFRPIRETIRIMFRIVNVLTLLEID